MRRQLLTWLVAGSMAVPAILAAQPMGVPVGRWWERPKVAAELALTGDQKASLETITRSSARAMIDLKADVDKAELDLKEVADAEPFAPAKVREAFKAFQQARTKLDTERFEMLIKIRDVLSVEQWHKLQELKQDRLREREGGGPGSAPREPLPSGRQRRP